MVEFAAGEERNLDIRETEELGEETPQESIRPRANWRNGLVSAAAFGIFGLLVSIPLLFNRSPLLSAPGVLPLKIFMSSMTLGHGGAAFAIFTNPLCYAAVGFLIGLFLKTRHHVLIAVGIFVVVALVGEGLGSGVRTWITRAEKARDIERLKDDALSKLRDDPDDVCSLHWMGVHHFTRTGDDDAAAMYFRRLVEIESRRGRFSGDGRRALIHLALVYQSWGKEKTAQAYFKQFMATKPDLNDNVLSYYKKKYLEQRKAKSDQRPR